MVTKCPKCDMVVDDVSIQYKLKHGNVSGNDICNIRPCCCTLTRITDYAAFAALERLKERKDALKRKRGRV